MVPKIVITIDGGIIQCINSDSQVKIVVIDCDIDGLDKKDISIIDDINGEKSEVYTPFFSEVNIDKDWVKKIHNEIQK